MDKYTIFPGIFSKRNKALAENEKRGFHTKEILSLIKARKDLEKEMKKLGVYEIDGNDIELSVKKFQELFPEVEGRRDRDYYNNLRIVYETRYRKLNVRAIKQLSSGGGMVIPV